QRNVGTGYRCRPCSTVCLDNITIDMNAPLSKLVQVYDRPERTSNKPLYFVSPPSDLPFCRLPGRTGRRRSGEHGVLGRDPPCPFTTEERRHALLYRGCADHLCIAKLDQNGAFSVFCEFSCNSDSSELTCPSSIASHILLHFSISYQYRFRICQTQFTQESLRKKRLQPGPIIRFCRNTRNLSARHIGVTTSGTDTVQHSPHQLPGIQIVRNGTD